MICRGERLARPLRLAAAAVLLVAGSAWPASPAGASTSTPTSTAPIAGPPPAALAEWTGGLNLWRDGAFSTQTTWLYCTAADIQMIKNILEGTDDHSHAGQAAYFEWMRTQNRYELPVSAGVDPAGWTAGMQEFVDPRYELVSSSSFGHSLATAVTRMRLTGLPVALAVAHGNHGWILHGFAATADPAATTDFEVMSVQVTGPLWGRQSSPYGYDMPPNTTLSVEQLREFFTRWHYDPLPMIWDGTFVSIQPRPDGAAPAPPPGATDEPAPPVAPTPSPATVPPPTPSPPPMAGASAPALSDAHPAADADPASDRPASTTEAAFAAPTTPMDAEQAADLGALLAVSVTLGGALVVGAVLVGRARRRRID